jgi:anti-sigma B factor antagonist
MTSWVEQVHLFGAVMATPRTQLLVEELAAEPDGGTVLRIHGELDIGTAEQLRRGAGPYLDAGRRLLLDLSRVTFCDSTGLAVLVGFHKRLAASGGRLELSSPVPRVRQLLAITGLDRVFTIRADSDADTGSSDTGSSDTGSSDTGSSDTESSDTGASDTGASGAGASGAGPGDPDR